MADLTSFVTGLSKSIDSYMGANQKQQREQQDQQVKSSLDTQQTEDQAKFTQGMQGTVSPEMAEGLIPGSGKWINSFHQQNGRLPTVTETQTGLNSVLEKLSALETKKGNVLDKQSQLQDKLEKQAQDRLTQVRGDQSLMRTETQRDAAGLAYDTIAKARGEGRDLSETEYTDVLGQLWKVRTGASPTEQVLNDLRSKTAKEGINRAITWSSGNPNLVGATTKETLDNLKQFVESSGNKADQQWDAYMQPRLVKPTDLDQHRWDHITAGHRGISFKEQKGVSDKTHGGKNSTAQQREDFRKRHGL